MTLEISVGGLSAATTIALEVGAAVNLSPVVGKRVAGIVSRKQGATVRIQVYSVEAQNRRADSEIV